MGPVTPPPRNVGPPCAFFVRARARFIGVPRVFARLDRVRVRACTPGARVYVRVCVRMRDYTWRVCAVITCACVVNTGVHSVRVVVAVAECLTAARNVCNLSPFDNTTRGFAHMGYTINDSDKRHNGWTNYATWRVNLEIFDGFNPSDYFSGFDPENVQALADGLSDYADQVLFECATVEGLAADYARAFLQDVNWYEIAQHMLDEIRSNA